MPDDSDVGFAYTGTLHGVFKLLEMGLSLASFLCAMIPHWFAYTGMGWVMFTTISAFVVVLVLLIVHLANLTGRIGPWRLVELAIYVVYTIFYVIAFIVASVVAGQHFDSADPGLNHTDALVACAVLTAVTFLVFLIDTMAQFLLHKKQTGSSKVSKTKKMKNEHTDGHTDAENGTAMTIHSTSEH